MQSYHYERPNGVPGELGGPLRKRLTESPVPTSSCVLIGLPEAALAALDHRCTGMVFLGIFFLTYAISSYLL